RTQSKESGIRRLGPRLGHWLGRRMELCHTHARDSTTAGISELRDRLHRHAAASFNARRRRHLASARHSGFSRSTCSSNKLVPCPTVSALGPSGSRQRWLWSSSAIDNKRDRVG